MLFRNTPDHKNVRGGIPVGCVLTRLHLRQWLNEHSGWLHIKRLHFSNKVCQKFNSKLLPHLCFPSLFSTASKQHTEIKVSARDIKSKTKDESIIISMGILYSSRTYQQKTNKQFVYTVFHGCIIIGTILGNQEVQLFVRKNNLKIFFTEAQGCARRKSWKIWSSTH